MKQLLLITLLLLGAVGASAQIPNKTHNYSQKEAFDAMRQQIGLDYSMPDYDTTSLNPNVIGVRLAKMLEQLKKSYDKNEYNHMLSMIRDEQLTDRRAFSLRVDEMGIKRITKKGNMITITVGTTTKVNKKQKYSNDIQMVFVDGLSESMTTNELFSQLNRYAK